MTRDIARALGSLILTTAWAPFLGCNLLQIGGTDEATFVVFADPDSDFSTSDVRDVDGEIVRFDSSTNSIIWAADGTAYQTGQWAVNGVFLAGGGFQVRFGTQDGERRAYFTETGPATICDICVGCGSVCIAPTSFTVPQEAVFVDSDSDFSTSDVRDVDDEIVRFDTSTNSIIWAADGTAYQTGQWTVNGVFLAGGGFQVRFGTQDGERRAYFTETGPATICQIQVSGGNLFISATNVTVPQE